MGGGMEGAARGAGLRGHAGAATGAHGATHTCLMRLGHDGCCSTPQQRPRCCAVRARAEHPHGRMGLHPGSCVILGKLLLIREVLSVGAVR